MISMTHRMSSAHQKSKFKRIDRCMRQLIKSDKCEQLPSCPTRMMAPSSLNSIDHRVFVNSKKVMLLIIVSMYKISSSNPATATPEMASQTGASFANFSSMANLFIDSDLAIDTKMPLKLELPLKESTIDKSSSNGLEDTLEIQLDRLVRWLVEQFGDYRQEKINGPVTLRRVHRNKRFAGNADFEMIDKKQLATTEKLDGDAAVKSALSVSPDLNVTHMRIRETQRDDQNFSRTPPDNDVPRTMAKRQSITANLAGMSDSNNDISSASDADPEFATVSPAQYSNQDDPDEADSGKTEEASNENNAQHQPPPEEPQEPPRPVRRRKTSKARKESTPLKLVANEPTVTHYTANSPQAIPTRVPSPELSNIRADSPISNELGELPEDDGKQSDQQVENVVPQVGDLEWMSRKRVNDAKRIFNQMASLSGDDLQQNGRKSPLRAYVNLPAHHNQLELDSHGPSYLMSTRAPYVALNSNGQQINLLSNLDQNDSNSSSYASPIASSLYYPNPSKNSLVNLQRASRYRINPDPNSHTESQFSSTIPAKPLKMYVVSSGDLAGGLRSPSGATKVDSTAAERPNRLRLSGSKHHVNFVTGNSYVLPAQKHSIKYDTMIQQPFQHQDQTEATYGLSSMVPNSQVRGANILGVPRNTLSSKQSSAFTTTTAPQAAPSQQYLTYGPQPVIPVTDRRAAALLAAGTSGSSALIGPYGQVHGVPATAYVYPSYLSSSSQQSIRNGFLASNKRHTSNAYRIGKQSTLTSQGAQQSKLNEDGHSLANPVASPATSDPLWSETQNQEDEYQQAPQTIQITAVPNGVGGAWNGANPWNGFVGNGFNNWGGPWNGRQVLLVNRQPQVGSEWRQWVLPVAAVLALPLILSALFVPVFLKSVMFLIQILQMLGLLMPPAQLAGHLVAGAHNSSVG